MTETSDFAILWTIGEAVLAGQTPYAVAESFYPPATSYLFALFALLPLNASIWIWRAVLVSLLGLVIRREGWWAALFLPLPFVIAAGQVDLIFVVLIPFLKRGGWQVAIAAALLTLKPILAVIILPWFVIRWLRNDRRTLTRFLGLSLALHAWPLLLRPTLWSEWIDVFGSATGHYFGGVGIWLLGDLGPAWPLVVLSICAVVGGLVNDERFSRAMLLFVSPFSLPYHTAILIGTAPAWVLAVGSIFAVGLFALTGSHLWLMLIPLSAIFHVALTIPTLSGRISLKMETN